MKYVNLSHIFITIGLALSVNVMSQTIVNAAGDTIEMTPEYHSIEMKGIKDQYLIDIEECAQVKGHFIKTCKVEAMAKQKINLANLEKNYRPNVKNRHNANIVKANADYSVAIEKCAELSGNEMSHCMKDARTVKMDDMMNAKAEMKMPENMPMEKSMKHHMKAKAL